MALRIDRRLGRYFLTDRVREEVDFDTTPQSRGQPTPPLEKPAPAGAERVKLPAPGSWRGVQHRAVEDAIRARRSHRTYGDGPLTLDELAFLLWAIQGVQGRPGATSARRTVPSAGCRHAFETYVIAYRVAGLPPALVRYLPLEHELVVERRPAPGHDEVAAAAQGQEFVARAAAVLFLTAVPARMEWRYAEAAYKALLLDAGHVGQNLYLACECVGAGTCAVAAYHQDRCDALLGVDGEEEFVVYLAPVGKL